MHGKLLYTVMALILLCPAALSARQPSAARSGADAHAVISEILSEYERLNDYTVQIQAQFRMPGFRIPDFGATIYFKRPDRFHIETKQFAPLPRNSGLFNPFLFDPKDNQIAYGGPDILDGVETEWFRVEPRRGDARIRFYRVWTGGIPKRILQVESHSVKGTKARVKPVYRTVRTEAGAWLLPESVHVHLTFPEGTRNPDDSLLAARDSPFSRGMARIEDIPSEGDIYIAYAGWQINRGLDDRLFQKKRSR